jgi:hypothetical protein
MSEWSMTSGELHDALERAQVPCLVEPEGIAEIEVVFDLYCELWEQVGDLPRRAAVLYVMEELAYSGVSEALAQALDDLRTLPFIESAAGPAGDRDSTWFGLQITLNQLLLRGKPLLTPEWHTLARAPWPSAGCRTQA